MKIRWTKKIPKLSLKLHWLICVKKVKINERDFLDRAELLCSLGQNVMITNFQEYYKIVEYFSEFTKARMALAMGVESLVNIFDQKIL